MSGAEYYYAEDIVPTTTPAGNQAEATNAPASDLDAVRLVELAGALGLGPKAELSSQTPTLEN